MIPNHTLPYELNIGKKLNHKLEGFELDFSVPERKFLMNDLRYEANMIHWIENEVFF